jgi:hypothetical protein
MAEQGPPPPLPTGLLSLSPTCTGLFRCLSLLYRSNVNLYVYFTLCRLCVCPVLFTYYHRRDFVRDFLGGCGAILPCQHWPMYLEVCHPPLAPPPSLS